MHRQHSTLHVTAAIFGGVCLAVEVFSNVEHHLHMTGSLLDATVLATIAVSVATAVSLAVAIAAIRQRAIITGLALLLGFGVGAGFSLTTTLDRVATQRDAAMSAKLDANAAYKAKVSELGGIDRMATSECMTGEGPRCSFLRAEHKRLEDEIARLVELSDSLGVRLSAALGIRPAAASLYQPFLLPLALFVFANWLLAFGIDGEKVPAEFDTGLKGRAALDAKAERFADVFQAQHGRAPKSIELEHALGISVAVARRMARQMAMVEA